MKPREKKKELTDLTVYDPQGQEIVYKKDMLEVIRNTVAKKATPSELYMFLSIANKYGLDPFAREIWFIKYAKGGQVQTRVETSRDGYLAIAQRDPDFMGVQSAVVQEKDEFTIEFGAEGTVTKINHVISGFNRGKIVGAWAVARHKTKDSVYAIIPMDEADQDQGAWRTHPSAMVRKVAEVDVLKRIAGISGLVTGEEMGTNVRKHTLSTQEIKEDRQTRNALREKPIDEVIDVSYEVKSTSNENEGTCEIEDNE